MMSENLKRLRKEKGLTQVELAEKLNLSQSTIASWENGKRRPDLDFLPVIADFFGVTVGEIYGQDESQPDEQDEAWAIRKRLRRDPAYRLLFDAADNATPEHLRAAAAMLKALEEGSGNID